MIRYTLRVEETPAHSKGWMAYKVPGQDKLQYGTTVVTVEGSLTVELFGEVRRVTRREKIRETRTISLAAGESAEIRRDISASNRYIVSIRAEAP